LISKIPTFARNPLIKAQLLKSAEARRTVCRVLAAEEGVAGWDHQELADAEPPTVWFPVRKMIYKWWLFQIYLSLPEGNVLDLRWE